MLTTPSFSSFPSSDKALIATRISECLADVRTSAHHLRLNLNKTELLLIPGKDCPHLDLLVTVEHITAAQKKRWTKSRRIEAS